MRELVVAGAVVLGLTAYVAGSARLPDVPPAVVWVRLPSDEAEALDARRGPGGDPDPAVWGRVGRWRASPGQVPELREATRVARVPRRRDLMIAAGLAAGAVPGADSYLEAGYVVRDADGSDWSAFRRARLSTLRGDPGEALCGRWEVHGRGETYVVEFLADGRALGPRGNGRWSVCDGALLLDERVLGTHGRGEVVVGVVDPLGDQVRGAEGGWFVLRRLRD